MSPSLSTKRSSTYITSFPGLLRCLNVCIGLTSIILTTIGFGNDLPVPDINHLYRTPYLTYYGLGYKQEGINHWSLGIICLCFSISLIFLLILFFVKGSEIKLKAWNRFLNLALSILLFLGWISGLVGFLMFRQGCCRVEILSTERIPYQNEGYKESCLCTIHPHNDPETSYPVLLHQDSPLGIRFLRADPHHFHGHVIALVLVLINVITYIAAFVFV